MSKIFIDSPVNRMLIRIWAVIFEFDPVRLSFHVSDTFYEITGYTQDDLSQSNWWLMLFPGQEQNRAEELFKLVSMGNLVNYELPITTKSGHKVTFKIFTTNEYDERGKLKNVVGFGLEVAGGKQTEQALKESEERYRLALESIKDYAIFTLDKQGYISSWNAGAEQMKGYSAKEIIGKHFSIFYTPDDLKTNLPIRELAQAIEDGRFEIEGWRVRKDKTQFWASIVITPIRVENGDILGFTKVVRDTTRRKKAEEDIRRQTSFVKLLQEVAVAANEATEIEDAVQHTLDNICSYTGWCIGHAWILEADELISLSTWYLGNSDEYLPFKQATEKMRLKAGDGLPGMVLANGKPVWITDAAQVMLAARSSTASDIGLKTGIAFPILVSTRVVGILEFFTEETFEPDQDLLNVMAHIGTQLGRVVERKQMEGELSELQRRLIDGREVERVQLARELHDGPIQDLYAILFNLKAFIDDLPAEFNNHLAREVLSRLRKVTSRLKSITVELRPPTLAPFGLEKAIRSHVEVYEELHPEISFSLDLSPDGQTIPEHVRMTLFRIYQSVLKNVIDHSNANQVWIQLALEDQQTRLEIQDNGSGFEVPDRWLAAARKGHLGLASAQERAQAIGAKFEIYSTTGKGTKVCISVPRIHNKIGEFPETIDRR